MTFAAHTIAAIGSISLSTALTYPLDTIKTLIQVGSGSNKELTPAQVLYRVRTLSGNSGLYYGFGWLALGRFSGIGARFGTYEILTAFYKALVYKIVSPTPRLVRTHSADGREDNYINASEALLAGIVAGAVESVITTPFELLKIRSQVTAASLIPSSVPAVAKNSVSPLMARLLPGYAPDVKALNQSIGLLSTLNTKYPNMLGALKDYPWMMTGSGRAPAVYSVRSPLDIVSLEGWGALWRGLRSGILRDSIFGGVFFSTWQVLHQAMLDWKAVSMRPPPRFNEEIGPLSPLSVSFAAGISGSFAAAASHCFDTAKSRSQCIVVPKFISMERKFLKWSRPGNRFESFTGIHPRDRNILFRGIWLRMARSGVASFILVGSYYFAVDQLVS